MSEREVYGIDEKGRIYRFQNKITFDFFAHVNNAKRIWKKDLPKDFKVYREYVEYDI